MNNRWWDLGEPQRRPRLLARLFGAAEPEVTPALILHLPPTFRAGQPRQQVAALDKPASTADWAYRILDVGTASAQYGFVKLWRAKSVDLRKFLWSQARLPAPSAMQAPSTPEPQPAVERRPPTARPAVVPTESDTLATRLFAVLQPPPEALLSPMGPLEWPGEFFPYQQQGVHALLQSPHLLLADDMGLGKTIQAIAAIRVLLMRREIERALIVTPAGLLGQWSQELRKWAPELRVMVVQGPGDRSWQWHYRAHVTLTSYETLRSDCTGSPTWGPCREEWGVVVLDEAQKVKNPEAGVSQACKRLPRRRSWALTGTPLENSAEDVISILEFVCDGDGSPFRFTPGMSLRSTLGQFQLRRRKADVLPQLPPKIVTDLVLPLTPAQRCAYDRAEQEGIVALRQLGEVRIEHVLALITHLKQICNFEPQTGDSAKLADLAERLDELTAAGHKALVFTQYVSDHSGARRIAERLKRLSPMVYTGDMAVEERESIIEQFKEEDDRGVLVLSLKAGGQGLNLQCASYVFHFDRWWNPAVERQAEDRTHRVGQTEHVHVYRYLMTDTIEQRIDEILRSKVHLFDQLVDTTSLDLSRLLNKRELFGLVGLEPPDAAATEAPGLGLEKRVARLLALMGYHVEQTARSRDGGVDVIAERTDAVGTRLRLFVQCKDTDRPAGVEVVRALNGILPQGDRGTLGVLVSPSGFTSEAKTFAFARHIQLWDAQKMTELEQTRDAT